MSGTETLGQENAQPSIAIRAIRLVGAIATDWYDSFGDLKRDATAAHIEPIQEFVRPRIISTTRERRAVADLVKRTQMSLAYIEEQTDQTDADTFPVIKIADWVEESLGVTANQRTQAASASEILEHGDYVDFVCKVWAIKQGGDGVALKPRLNPRILASPLFSDEDRAVEAYLNEVRPDCIQ